MEERHKCIKEEDPVLVCPPHSNHFLTKAGMKPLGEDGCAEVETEAPMFSCRDEDAIVTDNGAIAPVAAPPAATPPPVAAPGLGLGKNHKHHKGKGANEWGPPKEVPGDVEGPLIDAWGPPDGGVVVLPHHKKVAADLSLPLEGGPKEGPLPFPAHQKAVEGPLPAHHKGIEGPFPAHNKGTEGPFAPHRKGAEWPIAAHNKGLEGPPFPAHHKGIEGPPPLHNKGIEGPFPLHQKGPEGPSFPVHSKGLEGPPFPGHTKTLPEEGPLPLSTYEKAADGAPINQWQRRVWGAPEAPLPLAEGQSRRLQGKKGKGPPVPAKGEGVPPGGHSKGGAPQGLPPPHNEEQEMLCESVFVSLDALRLECPPGSSPIISKDKGGQVCRETRKQPAEAVCDIPGAEVQADGFCLWVST